MAILWQRTRNGRRYEVRSAGRTRRLYTNGVCHSEFNPRRVLTGSIWDLLILPAFIGGCNVRRVLLLGVGGGAVLSQLHALLAPACMIGVESDAMHLSIARRFFSIGSGNIELHESCARDWLQRYEGPPFDLIIDDLFTDDQRRPVRAVTVDKTWSRLLLRHLHRGGVLSINFGGKDEFGSSACLADAGISSRFAAVFQLTCPGLDNVVGAFLRRAAVSADLRRNLRRFPLLENALSDKKLRYRIRKV